MEVGHVDERVLLGLQLRLLCSACCAYDTVACGGALATRYDGAGLICARLGAILHGVDNDVDIAA